MLYLGVYDCQLPLTDGFVFSRALAIQNIQSHVKEHNRRAVSAFLKA